MSPTSCFLDVSSQVWRACLTRVRHEAYHLPEYVALDADLASGRPLAFHYQDGERELLLPLVLREVAGSRDHDATSPYGYPGPVASTTDEGFWKDAMSGLVEVLKDADAISCFVRLDPLLPGVLGALDGIGNVVQHGETVSIDLRQDYAQIYAGFRANHRRQISRSRQGGRGVVVDDWSLLPCFVEAYYETMTRVHAADYYFFAEEYFTRLRDKLGPAVHLMVAVKDGEFLAGGLFLERGGIVQYHLGATKTEALREQPTKLVFDEVCRWAKARGDVDFHLGAGIGGESDPLFHFKAGFSDRRHPFHTLRIVVDEDAYDRRSAHAAGAREGRKAVGGYFPAYRSPAEDGTQPPMPLAPSGLNDELGRGPTRPSAGNSSSRSGSSTSTPGASSAAWRL